jgi:hypothetical protein
MKGCNCRLVLPFILGIILVGCVSRAPYTVKHDFEKTATKVIAVLPVNNKTPDLRAPQLLRSKVLAHLYFKGYSKLPSEVIDSKLEPLYKGEKKDRASFVAPQVLKELVGADAVMYCTLTEGKRSVRLFYAPLTMAARCELRSTQTGEILWSAEYKSTSRNFDLTGKRLEMKSFEAFESVMEEIVNKLMETLPDGPNLRG